MENNRAQYKDFVIFANPYQLQDSKRWRAMVTIGRITPYESNFRPFTTTDKTYESEEEARKHCFNLGRKIIDGEISGCSVDDLENRGDIL